MSKINNVTASLKKKDVQQRKRYATQKLLKSKHLAGYQPDFAKVILIEPAYSVAEAKAALDRALKGED